MILSKDQMDVSKYMGRYMYLGGLHDHPWSLFHLLHYSRNIL